MKLAFLILFAVMDIVPSGKASLEPLQERDSVLIADQFRYGFRLDGVADGTVLELQDPELFSNGDSLVLVRGWQLDTVSVDRRSSTADIEGSVVITSFEEGVHRLPPVAVRRTLPGGVRTDTLLFEPGTLDVKTMPVDTATFVVHDIKGQMLYPLTFREVLPWLLGVLILAGAVAASVWLVRRRKSRGGRAEKTPEEAYIVALRELDKFRSDRFWAPEQQKSYYSGITDVLKSYIESAFGIDAPEMTTLELFSALKDKEGIPAELLASVRELFESADYVKFAKHVVSRDEASSALPVAAKFVMTTHQARLEEERSEKNVL